MVEKNLFYHKRKSKHINVVLLLHTQHIVDPMKEKTNCPFRYFSIKYRFSYETIYYAKKRVIAGNLNGNMFTK